MQSHSPLIVRATYFLYHASRKLLRKVNIGFLLMRFPMYFEQDGLATSRLRTFENDPLFLEAKAQTIRNIGLDFEIDWRTHVFIWAFRNTVNLPGHALELGTGKAWMFTMLLNYSGSQQLKDVILVDRFSDNAVDSYSGKVIDGKIHDSYTSDIDAIRKRFMSCGGNVQIVQGEIPQVLESLKISEVRFLHLDLNAAKPETDSLRMLWPQLVKGAVVLLDDYGSPEFVNSHVSMNNLSNELQFDILGLPTGQGLIIKR